MDFFDYFQLTAISLTLLIAAARTVYLMIQGTNILVFGTGEKGLHGYVEVFIYAGYAVWAAAIILQSLKLEQYVFPYFLTSCYFNIFFIRIIGAVFITAGFAGVTSATFMMKDSWRLGIDTTRPGKLVSSGILRISRNPIYLSYEIYLLGTWLIYSNLFFLLSFITIIILLHYQIKEEEKFLLKTYGIDYMQYMQKVRRYI